LLLGIDVAGHPIPTLATAVEALLFFGLLGLLGLELTKDPETPHLMYDNLMRWLIAAGVISVVNLSLFHFCLPANDVEYRFGEYVFWGVPCTVFIGFFFAVREMRSVDQSVASLSTLKYKLKGA
jgi:hypothetical protein